MAVSSSCSTSLTPPAEILADDDRWLCRKEVARMLSFSTRTVDRMDSYYGPDRTFPYSRRIVVPGRKRPFRRWLLSEILKYMHDRP
jgi:predicted DNA-binding transcriptional regulator AlpA